MVSIEWVRVTEKTKGRVPPKLAGASTTVIGNKVYLFGGRLVAERYMLADLYVLDLETSTWDKIDHAPDHPVPSPRYFHSADAWNEYLIIFGGMGYETPDQEIKSLRVLNDLRFYSVQESRWIPEDEAPSSLLPPQFLIPRARYAHLSSISSGMLFIIGGQDLSDGWLDDICAYNLSSRTWVQRCEYPRQRGMYRSLAVSLSDDLPSPPPPRVKSPESPIELSSTSAPAFDYTSDIILYTNYNFSVIQREFDVITPKPPALFTVADRSTLMSNNFAPPGLRFPFGALSDNTLIIAGTYISKLTQSFAIWSLDLTSMKWSPGVILKSGSWSRAVFWRDSKKIIVFGNREGNLADDYNHRTLSWEHVAHVYQKDPDVDVTLAKKPTADTVADTIAGTDVGETWPSVLNWDYEVVFNKTSPQCLDGQITRISQFPVASGGYADIWEGFLGEQRVAIKTVRQFSDTGYIDERILLKRLWREYLAWSWYSHAYPHINVHQCLGFSYELSQQRNTLPSFISPWMSNGTVVQYLKRNPETDRMSLLVGIADGLSFLHRQKPPTLHGDLRAGNILISDSGAPCLSDFGLSRVLTVKGMSSSSEVSGSLRWMAPELLDDDTGTTLQSDVWAYGMTVLEILSGHHPYKEVKKDIVVLGKIMAGQLPIRPQDDEVSRLLDDKIWELCQQCWITEPLQRPSSQEILMILRRNLS